MRKVFETGLYDIPYSEYRNAIGISNSDLSLASKTLAHYKWKQDSIEKGVEDSQDSEALLIGHLFHEIVLEPQKNTLKNCVIKPEELSLRTKDGKQWCEAHKNKTIITLEQKKMLEGMAKSVWAHPRAKLYLSNGVSERSIFVRDEETNLMLKLRPDYLPNPSSNLVCDVKTTSDASREGFQRSIGRCGYHKQASFYLDGVNKLGTMGTRDVFAIIAIEKNAPFPCNIFILTPEAIEAGRQEYRMLLNKVSNAIKENKFPACEETEIMASIPEFYLKQKQ